MRWNPPRGAHRTVVVVTDRLVLDQQLQDTIYQFEHKTGVVEKIDVNTQQLARALFETAGSLREGRDVWVLIRFVIDDPVVRETLTDEVVPFGFLSNNHAGERRVILQETPIRVVCANTLGAAQRSADRRRVFHVRHTVHVTARTVDAAQYLWGALIERYRTVAEQYRVLRASYLSDAAFSDIVMEQVAPLPITAT